MKVAVSVAGVEMCVKCFNIMTLRALRKIDFISAQYCLVIMVEFLENE